MFLAIDAVLQARPQGADLSGYGRLGLAIQKAAGRRQLNVGSFAFQWVAEPSEDAMLRNAWDTVQSSGRTSLAVVLRVGKLDAVSRNGIRGNLPDGREAVFLDVEEQAGANIVLVRDGRSPSPDAHGFPLRRLDHLAAVTHDLEAKCRYWEKHFGMPITGEVVTPTMVIRQIRIGDAMLELLGPAGVDSPLMKRVPGLISMASWEVADIDESVSQARSAGFEVPDPTPGVLPETRITTLPGTSLAGINMQFLQYV
ncbi:MAG: VOC family protein [Gemmataceae bacterium]|nr:VOC family protein [Gemmataceae bacterium]